MMRGLTFKARYTKEEERSTGEGEEAGEYIQSHTNMLSDSPDVIHTCTLGLEMKQPLTLLVSYLTQRDRRVGQ